MRPGGPGPPPRHRCLIAALVCLRAGTAPGPGASAFSPSAVQWGSGRAGTVRRRLPLPSLPAPPPRQAEAEGRALEDGFVDYNRFATAFKACPPGGKDLIIQSRIQILIQLSI